MKAAGTVFGYCPCRRPHVRYCIHSGLRCVAGSSLCLATSVGKLLGKRNTIVFMFHYVALMCSLCYIVPSCCCCCCRRRRRVCLCLCLCLGLCLCLASCRQWLLRCKAPNMAQVIHTRRTIPVSTNDHTVTVHIDESIRIVR